MTINKFTGKTIEEAIEKARKEMGPGMKIIDQRSVKPKGLFSFLKQSYYEVTAGVEGDEDLTAASMFLGKTKPREGLNLSADEKISLPNPSLNRTDNDLVEHMSATYTRPQPKKPTVAESPAPQTVLQSKLVDDKKASNEPLLKDVLSKNENIEERLQSLTALIEENMVKKDAPSVPDSTPEKVSIKDTGMDDESLTFLKLLYNTLIDNEVDERYANQILDDVMKVKKNGNGIEYLLSSAYQKMILKFGTPSTIKTSEGKPKVVFFIGPTGVGKTTTIAKLASEFKLNQKKKVAILTADTYRIKAIDQLKEYAEILKTPFEIIYSPSQFLSDSGEGFDKFSDNDLIFVDTAGFSHKSENQRDDTKKLIEAVPNDYECQVYLVLSSTTKYRDLKDICDTYKSISEYSLIFTKLDETNFYGNLFNIKLYSKSEISYITNGQNVPGDIEVFSPQDIVKKLLGGE